MAFLLLMLTQNPLNVAIRSFAAFLQRLAAMPLS